MASKEKTLNEMNVAKHVAEIVHHGTKLTLPEGMEIPDAIDLLKRKQKYLEEEVVLRESFQVFPQDGAHALDTVLTRKFGWSPAEAIPSFFGSQPPQMITIDVGYNKVKKVPWGRFSLPTVGAEGFVQCGVAHKDGRNVFELVSKVQRKYEPVVKELFDELRAELKTNSIFMGKAFKMRFCDEHGSLLEMPEPQFIDTTDISEDMLVYSQPVMNAIKTSLFTPIARVKDCVANGIPVKRGVLLGGPYGTGKTLAAKVASKLAVENGVTYLYVERADELAHAVSFAKLYSNPACVIFCEDIDRSVTGERTAQMDSILNIVDGIDTKSSNIIVVLTSNHMDNINPAMLRPGRLDAVIDVTPPDAEAVAKLIRLYGGNTIKPDTDLTEVCKVMENSIPAVIAEVVKRSKLAQLSLQEPGTKVTELSAEALLISAKTMDTQLSLLYKDRSPAVSTIHSTLVDAVNDVVDTKLTPVIAKLNDIAENM